MDSTPGKVGLCLGVLVLVVIFEVVLGEILFDASQDFIPWLQEDAGTFKKGYWKWYSNFMLMLLIIGPILGTFVFIEQRSRCFYYLFILCGIIGITNLLKLLNHQARPFWIPGTQIQAFTCEGQYGNPSGHSSYSMAVCLAMWLDLKDLIPERRWYWIQILFAASLLSIPFVIAYTRLFLGVHSLNQVSFGLQLGAWFAVTSHYLVKDEL